MSLEKKKKKPIKMVIIPASRMFELLFFTLRRNYYYAK